MARKYYSVQNKTENSVDILIYGVIGDSWFEESITARRFVADLKALENDYARINVRINSPGGSVFDGLPIFNAMRASKAEIHTYNEGLCASMGAVLLMAAPAGNVHSADNALTMLHSPSTGAYGNARDIRQVLGMLDKVQDSLISCIASRGTKTSEEIKAQYFDYNDHWLSADEAKTEGLVDLIEKGTKKISNKITGMPLDKIMDEFDSLVKGKGFFDRFFSQAHDMFTPNDDTDMDIKVLRTACKLGEKATEQEILDWINNHQEETTEETQEEETEETEEETEETEETEEETEETEEETEETEDARDQRIAELEAENEALKKGPGAKNKRVVKKTDSTKTTTDGFESYSNAKETWDKVDKLFK
jgi:ATP-dependent Clp endopeptidase proteolytic subunit ClpP